MFIELYIIATKSRLIIEIGEMRILRNPVVAISRHICIDPPIICLMLPSIALDSFRIRTAKPLVGDSCVTFHQHSEYHCSVISHLLS